MPNLGGAIRSLIISSLPALCPRAGCPQRGRATLGVTVSQLPGRAALCALWPWRGAAPRLCPEGRPGPPGTAPAAFQELPDPEKVAAEVQQMWALTEVVRARQAAARIGRFDVSAALTRSTGGPGGWGGRDTHTHTCAGIPAALPEPSGAALLPQVDGCYDVNLLSYS